MNKLIDWADYIKDSSNKRRYRCFCSKCNNDRGYQRPAKRFLLCQSCGQKGKISGMKDKKLSPESKKKISIANYKWRKKKNKNYEPLSSEAKRIAHNLRTRLWQAVKNSNGCIRYLGCSIQELKSYLGSLFLPGMTWENYGLNGWEIDHIKPLSSFDLSNAEDLRKACHYTNLQPLWREDNRSKGCKYE